MSNSVELKPCPFCGGVCLTETHVAYHVHHNKGCLIGSFTEIRKSDREKIVKWNTRATDPLLKEMAEALEKLLRVHDRIIDHGEDALSTMVGISGRAEAREVLQKYHNQHGE